MNDTTRDELRKQVGGELVIAYTIGSDRKETDFTDTADRIIALVTAARDAEIRERLEHTYDEFRCENTDGMGGLDRHSSGYLEGLSFAIGLHGDETGGQG